jgi:hypothetical protein
MGSSNTQGQNALHFVGSVPLPSGREVFETLARRFGSWLNRIPDGETGERTNWIQYQEDVFARHPDFQRIEGPADPRSGTAKRAQTGKFDLKSGAKPTSASFGDLGYARSALESFADYKALRASGIISPGQKFMYALPSPYNVISFCIMPDSQAAAEIPYEARLLEELDEILAKIPHQDLSIQWDCAHDMQAFDGARTPWFSPAREGIIDRLARLGNHVPADVEMGYHFCYGSYGGRHFVEPKSMEAMVDLANGILGKLTRSLDYLHMPVPIERDDDAYFEPLRRLKRPEGMEVYLGLIHERDGEGGTLRRHATAKRYLNDFGLSTECGFGRYQPEEALQILETHSKVMQALDGRRGLGN